MHRFMDSPSHLRLELASRNSFVFFPGFVFVIPLIKADAPEQIRHGVQAGVELEIGGINTLFFPLWMVYDRLGIFPLGVAFEAGVHIEGKFRLQPIHQARKVIVGPGQQTRQQEVFDKSAVDAPLAHQFIQNKKVPLLVVLGPASHFNVMPGQIRILFVYCRESRK